MFVDLNAVVRNNAEILSTHPAGVPNANILCNWTTVPQPGYRPWYTLLSVFRLYKFSMHSSVCVCVYLVLLNFITRVDLCNPLSQDTEWLHHYKGPFSTLL